MGQYKENDDMREYRPSGNDSDWGHFDWRQGKASWQQDGGALHQDYAYGSSSRPPKRTREPFMSTTLAAAFLYAAGVLAAAFLFATLSWHWAGDVLALNKTETTAEVTVTENETLDSVAQQLREHGLIQYEYLFKLFAGFTHKADSITSGTYRLTSEMDYSALLRSMSAGSNVRETVTVTIPEGYTNAELFQLLEDKGVCSAADLEESAANDTFDYAFLSEVSSKVQGGERLEGYLFPDTYEFYKGTSARSVLGKMLSNFDNRFDNMMKAELDLLEKEGYSKRDIIILASIIEGETDGTDQKNIASVLYNRLKYTDREMSGKLECDSTVQFILPQRKAHLSNDDISIDSPYNTYYYAGLPVGAICNPGLTAIQAALDPAQTDYYYFMLGNDDESHFFEDKDAFNDFKETQNSETGETENQ